VSILAALAHPTRLRIVKRLAEAHELAGADLAQGLGISRALLCHHAGILVDAGIAMRRKAGQAGYLRLNERRLQQCFAKLQTRAPRVTRSTKR
jgi:DNA-binding transcriptional ArsR family regulator